MKKKLFTILFIPLIDICSMYLFKNYSDIFFPMYRNISKNWISFIAKLNNFTSVAVWDCGLFILIILFVLYIVYVFKNKKPIIKSLLNVVLVILIIASTTLYGWFLNHYSPKLYTYLDFEVEKYSVEQLYETCEYYLLEAAKYSSLIDRDNEGHIIKYDFDEFANIAGKAYSSISNKYPIFEGANYKVKKISLLGKYLMYNGISGMFMPVTGEAGVPEYISDQWLAFDMAHEAAHRLGIASEQEANFSAFLACINNDDIRFKYTGYYCAFSYCLSSLLKEDEELALELYHKYDEDINVQYIQLDRHDSYLVYQQYESDFQDISDKINDAYLKSFSQESGIKSYGEVTDYLIAYHLSII